MPRDFITSVKVEPQGGYDHVQVWVRGELVGVLITKPDDGERIKNALLGAKYFGVDRPVDSPITRIELFEWRVLATGWLDVENIITAGDTGLVGRIILRLLDALLNTENELERTRQLNLDAENTLSECHAALKASALFVELAERRPEIIAPSSAAGDVPSLTKDFHVLYRLTERLVADLDEDLTRIDLEGAKAQLRRLMPAFEECEAARRMALQTRGRN
jgi:hypothetical protein